MNIVQLTNTISETFINWPLINDSIPTLCIWNSDNNEDKNSQHIIYLNSEKIILDKDNVIKIDKSLIKNESLFRIYVDKSNSSNFSFYIGYIEDGSDNVIPCYECIYTISKLKGVSSEIYKNGNILNTDHSSFMLLRTNPKLTGNIKLVVDEYDNMYLDTFKINDELSDKKYRKAKISGRSYYSNDVRNVFKDMSSTSLYGIPESGNNIFDVKKDMTSQYIDVYNYGVKTNIDKLYSENFSMLAPLWINKVLPDFFVIFRIDDYKNLKSINPTDRLKECIRNGKVIKTYDFRKNSPLGNYLRNAQSEIDNYMSSVYISYNEYDYNSWYGISIDNGIVTTSNETTYDYIYIHNQVQFDNYITLGYERNRMISPYIINFEFMFNDNDSKNYSINQYIGFYISNNEYMNIYNLKYTSDDIVKYIDVETDKSININNIDNINNSLLKDRIFNLTYDVSTFDNFYRFNSSTELLSILNTEKFKNTPYKNILSVKINDELNSKFHPQFLTITINKPLHTGEHLRIIDSNNNHIIGHDNSVSDDMSILGAVYDVIGCKITDDYNNIDEYYDNNSEETINYINYICKNNYNDNVEKYVISHQNIFTAVDDYNDIDENEIIKKQVKQIVKSFNRFTDKPFKISTYSDDSITFMALDPNNILKFERISSEIIYDSNKNDIDSIDDIEKYVTYFNNFVLPSTHIKIENEYKDDNVLYLPNNFEVWNNRYAYIVEFVNYNILNDTNQTTTKNCWSYTIDRDTVSDIDRYSLVKISSDDNRYEILGNFNVLYYTFNDDNDMISNLYTDNPTNMIISPLSHKSYILQLRSEYPAELNNNNIHLYSVAPLHFSIAGFLPIKDFNFNVLDKKTKINGFPIKNSNTNYNYTYNDNNYIRLIINANEIKTIDPNKLYIVEEGAVQVGNEIYTAAGNNIIPMGTKSIKSSDSDKAVISIYSYIKNQPLIINSIEKEDESIENILNYFDIKSDSNFNDETLNELYKSNKKSDIPLITATNCKWNINGIDIFGNKIKELFDKSGIVNGINSLYLDTSLFGYSSYKYLSIDDKSLYIYNDINDVASNNKSLKDNILSKNMSIIDLFSDPNLSINNKFSLLSYNKDLNSLETIFFGKKLVLSCMSNELYIEKYNNYLFTVICSPSSNTTTDDTIEFFIDDNNSIILCIWYQKTGNGSYTYRDRYIIDNIYDSSYMTTAEHGFIKLKNNIDLSDIIHKDYIPINGKIDNIEGANLFISAISENNKNITYIKDSYTYNIKNLKSDNTDEYSIYVKDASIYKSITSYEYNNSDIVSNSIFNDLTDNINETNNRIDEYLIFDSSLAAKDNNYSHNISIDDIKGSSNILYVLQTGKTYINSISIEFEEPINIKNKDLKTYSAYTNPDIFDIIVFDNNESEDIINLTQHNYISSNTSVKHVNSLKQLWHNKISNNPNSFYKDNDNIELGIDYEPDYNIVKTMWDNNIIKMYTAKSNNVIKYPAYYLGDSFKTFFGSTALTINDNEIELDKWNDILVKIDNKTFNNSNDEIIKYNVKINISDALLNYFLNNQDFVNNWPNDSYEYMKKYIQNIIFNYFIINNTNNIKIYKTYNSYITTDNKVINFDNSLSYSEAKNIKIDLYKDNDIYYLEAELPNDNYQYMFKCKLTK